MKRYRQTFEEIVSSLIPVEASWLDDHAEEVIKMIQALPAKESYDAGDVMAMMDTDYETAFTVIRLFLDQSKATRHGFHARNRRSDLEGTRQRSPEADKPAKRRANPAHLHKVNGGAIESRPSVT